MLNYRKRSIEESSVLLHVELCQTNIFIESLRDWVLGCPCSIRGLIAEYPRNVTTDLAVFVWCKEEDFSIAKDYFHGEVGCTWKFEESEDGYNYVFNWAFPWLNFGNGNKDWYKSVPYRYLEEILGSPSKGIPDLERVLTRLHKEHSYLAVGQKLVDDENYCIFLLDEVEKYFHITMKQLGLIDATRSVLEDDSLDTLIDVNKTGIVVSALRNTTWFSLVFWKVVPHGKDDSCSGVFQSIREKLKDGI